MLSLRRIFGTCAYSIAILSLIVSTPSPIQCRQAYAIPSANTLDVPYRAQQTNYYCGPASVQMGFEYLWNISVIPQDLLATEMKTDPVKGVTYTSMMHVPFANRGYMSARERRYVTSDELKTQNSLGFISILLIWSDTDHKYGHYVVVIGYNATGIFVNDPWPTHWSQPRSRKTGKNAFISDPLLADLWTNYNQWVLEIPYRPYTVKQHIMCREVEKSVSPWRPTGVTDRFSTADDQVFSFFELIDAMPPFDLRFVWLAPDGTSTRLDPLRVTWRSGTAYAWIKMEGTGRPVGIWTVEVYADDKRISSAKFTLMPALELVSKIFAPKEGEPIFAGDTVTATYELRNIGKTTLKAVNFAVGTPLPRDVSLLEATSPKDMAPGTTEKFAVKIKFEKEGSYKLVIQAYVNGVLTEEAPLAVQVSPLPVWRNPILVGIIVAVVLVALVAAFLLMRRKRGPSPATPTTPTHALALPRPTGPVTTKYCINCGQSIPADAKHCIRCGATQE